MGNPGGVATDEAFLARVLGSTGAATIVVNPRARVVYWNAAATRMFAWTAEEAHGQNCLKLIVEEAAPHDSSEVFRNLQLGEEWTGEVTLRDKHGRSFVGLVTDSPVLDHKGELDAVVCVIVDITAQRNTEDALRASERLYHGVFDQGIEAIARLVEIRDPYVDGHQRRVGHLGARICRRLGFGDAFTDGVRIAGTLHDIGKVAIPSEILAKPGRLTTAEFELIKEHPQAGHDVIAGIESPWPTPTVILQHHERMDGSGYPHGLVGEDILIQSRIVAVADVVEAISSHRPYRPAKGVDAAADVLREGRTILFDADVVDACLGLLRESSLDQLTSG